MPAREAISKESLSFQTKRRRLTFGLSNGFKCISGSGLAALNDDLFGSLSLKRDFVEDLGLFEADRDFLGV